MVTLIRCRKIVNPNPSADRPLSHTSLDEADIPEKALKGKSISNHIKYAVPQHEHPRRLDEHAD
jgi:hypothetical protein